VLLLAARGGQDLFGAATLKQLKQLKQLKEVLNDEDAAASVLRGSLRRLTGPKTAADGTG
jgi:hypothetical protein